MERESNRLRVAEPASLFAAWVAEAERCEAIRYASAACLSTLGEDGFPDGRIVLVRLLSDQRIVFSTDERSAKGRQLALHPRAALTFHWEPLERQVRLQGSVEVTDDEAAELCFAERPRGSRITAWASTQSSGVANREMLDREYEHAAAGFDARAAIPRPKHWRAYRLRPQSFEFWQARRFRLHDRLRFEVAPEGGWRRHRLRP